MVFIGSDEVKKRVDESERQYIWRIGQLYDSDTLVKDDTFSKADWSDVAKLLNRELREEDVEYTESVYRKQYRVAVGFFNDVFKGLIEDKDGDARDNWADELDVKQRDLQKEKYKFYDSRNAYNKVLRDRSRQEELNEILVEAIKDAGLPELGRVFAGCVGGGYVPASGGACPSPTDASRVFVGGSSTDASGRTEFVPTSGTGAVSVVRAQDLAVVGSGHGNGKALLVSLNDLHVGADINNAFNVYNSDVCAERLGEYVRKVRDINGLHNCDECVVWCNGDMINGNIHYSVAVTNRENVVQQIVKASELLSGFLAALSFVFPRVRFVSVAGNHSRIRHKEESLKDERLDMLVEFYLKARLQNYNNVVFDDYNKVDATLYVLDVLGKKFVGVHGDYDDSVKQLQALQTMLGGGLYAVLSGHRHHNRVGSVQGVKTVMAGSFLGVDDYCISRRIFGRPEQIVSVVDGGGFVCHYDVVF